MSNNLELANDSYTEFVRRNFRAVYQFCAENGTEHDYAVIAAQRIIFDLYHLEGRVAHAA